MIGTSISMQSSGKMVYPSITICDGDSPTYAKERFFETIDHFVSGLSNGTKNYTYPLIPDLSKMFVQLRMKMSSKTTFTLKPDDLEDRDLLYLSLKFLYLYGKNRFSVGIIISYKYFLHSLISNKIKGIIEW